MGDRPCKPHKDFGVVCSDCPHYDPVRTRVLIIKLGATGDVLRTTALLGSIHDLIPNVHITWVCGAGSFPLIQHNPLIDRPLLLNLDTLIQLDIDHYHLCINFDLSPEAVSLAERVRADLYRGFGRDDDRAVTAFTPEAEEWLEMSLWDDLKKANTRTYQSHMRQIIEASEENHSIIVPLLPEFERKAEIFAVEQGIAGSRPLVGFNVGAGDRWQHKKWTVEGFVGLAERLYKTHQTPVLVYYGPVDQTRAAEVMQALATPYVDMGLHPDILEFIAWLNLCDVLVTGDTLALHAALGLGKRVVCLVGPTSAAELELYGQGVVLQGQIDCLGCYLTRCAKDPYCMKLLESDTVFQAVEHEIGVRV